MVKNKHPVVPKTENIELLDLLPRIMLFPGEDKTSFDGLRQALMLDLGPRSPYETALAENLVTLEWEAIRHRNMRDSLVRGTFRNLAIGAFQRGEINTVYKSDIEQDAYNSAHALLSSNHEQRGIAETELEDLGISIAEILAEAHRRDSRFVEVHERQLADIEIRRRRLLKDLDDLKATRATPVEEAEVLGD